MKKIKSNVIDKAIAFVSPVRAAKRYKARAVIAVAESWQGASKKRRSLSSWLPGSGDADTDNLPYLQDLRDRSRDLIRNNPLAVGAINTKVTSIVGTGLKLQSRINRITLGMSEEQADLWEKRTESEWKLWADSQECDIERTLKFAAIQELAFRSTLESGDVFILTPSVKRAGSPYGLKLQLVEADRVTNPDNKEDSDGLAGGVEKDSNGSPVAYHILDSHPGNLYNPSVKWLRRDAFGKTGRRNVLHLYHKKRIGQSRGVPDLAPVIEEIKQLGRYTEAEVTAAVVSAFFTVFVKSEDDNGLGTMASDNTSNPNTTNDFAMGPGAILDLSPDEDITTANPGRPNQAFDPFVLAVTRQIGAALELPFEILIKHFTASYSASRAALLEAWRYFMNRRKWLADNFCRPVYELFLTEAIAIGRISAPGFLNGDPLIRQAYLGSEWIGPAKGMIQEKQEVEAAEKRMILGLSTLAEETAMLTGGDWEEKHPQRVKEVKKRRDDELEEGFGVEAVAGEGAANSNEEMKSLADTYGVAVRAGAVTPQEEDEEFFRGEIGLPVKSKVVATAWEDDGGTRRPITLKAGDVFEAEGVQVTDPDKEEDDE